MNPHHNEGLRVLLVDDDATLLRLGERMIRRLGYQVQAFTNGERAIEHVEVVGEYYSIAIVDRMMPGFDGEQTCKALGKACPGTCLVVASGYPRDQGLAGWSGPDVAYLRKPYSLESLHQCLLAST